MKCSLCEQEYDKAHEQFWNLNNYFGISGKFCSSCYDKVSHDAYKQPVNPEEYIAAKVQLELLKWNNKH